MLLNILLSNTQSEQPCETLCSHPGYINNFVLMATTTYCIKHNRSCETSAVFTVQVDILRFLSPLFSVQNVTFLPVPIPVLNWLSLSKAFFKARGLHCLDHLYHNTGSFFQTALHSFIFCCKNMYIMPIFNHISNHQLNFSQFTWHGIKILSNSLFWIFCNFLKYQISTL